MTDDLDIQMNALGLLVAVKAVPGASRDQIAGRIGRRLKIRVAAAPEDGQANARILEVLAKALGVARRDLTIRSGQRHTDKMILIRTKSPEAIVTAIEQLAP